MTEAKLKVKNLCEEIYKFGFSQIVIDIVQDNVEELVEQENITPDEIGAQAYELSILIDVYNPALEKDLTFLTDLMKAIREWGEQAEQVNKLLGIDPNQ